MKPYISYVDYMLREYFARGSQQNAPTDVDRTNDGICTDVLRGVSQDDVGILREVFKMTDRLPMNECVRRFCVEQKADSRAVWSLVRKITDQIARRKELI